MKKQTGITLFEVVIALGIMSVMVAGTAALIERSNADTRAAVAAQQMRTVGDAASAYIKDNYIAVTANATPTQPALIRVSDLIAGGYLTTGATTVNAYQQNQCVLVLEPTANNLTALVVTENGSTIDDITLGGLVSLISAAGGGIYSTDTTKVRGAMGGWEFATGNYANANHLGQHCDGTAGVVTLAAGHPSMALWFANGNITSGFLYRTAVPGHPELNRMDTALDMNSNVISNIATLQLNTIVTNGTACPTNGVVGRDTNGAVLSCQSLTWKTQGGGYWKDPKPSYAELPSTGNSTGDTRIVTGLARPAAFTWTGSAWSALSIDQNGNLSVPGTLSVTGATTLSSATISGTATIANLAGNLQVTATAVEGAACTGEGRIAASTTTSGLILSCQSGIWKAQANGGLGSTVTVWDGSAACNAKIGVAYTNSSSKIRIVLASISNGNWAPSSASINGIVVARQAGYSAGTDSEVAPYTLLVPPGATYRIDGGNWCSIWSEWS